MIGYVRFSPSAKLSRSSGTLHRRWFWLLPHDRDSAPEGLYATGAPVQTVDRQTLTAGGTGLKQFVWKAGRPRPCRSSDMSDGVVALSALMASATNSSTMRQDGCGFSSAGEAYHVAADARGKDSRMVQVVGVPEFGQHAVQLPCRRRCPPENG
ncbi:DUF6009 family protein [Streptomyces chartreusis]|uniref:DUF6009 family protein n=1 Tax=Streptomyces chartreusis TaxID=1969 RepID=UPI0036AA49CD